VTGGTPTRRRTSYRRKDIAMERSEENMLRPTEGEPPTAGERGEALSGLAIKLYCTHARAMQFYSFRSADTARLQRDIMARNPHYSKVHVSAVYESVFGGWAWTVCRECAEHGRPRSGA
jgi:hypothetical protein